MAGALTVFGFAALHAAWISDIWSNIVPMVVTGAVCGLCIVWSYTQAVERHSPALWFTYNAGCAATLVGLGGASFTVVRGGHVRRAHRLSRGSLCLQRGCRHLVATHVADLGEVSAGSSLSRQVIRVRRGSLR